jgi:hypothetical protein
MEIHELPLNGETLPAKNKVRARPRVLIITVILINIELMLFAAWSLHEFGSIWGGLAYLKGDRLLADPYILSFGNLRTGDFRTMELTLDNRADHDIKIHSASRANPCFVLNRLPIAIGSGRKARITIAVQPEVVGPIQQHVVLFTDDQYQPFIQIVIWGKVVETSAQNADG